MSSYVQEIIIDLQVNVEVKLIFEYKRLEESWIEITNKFLALWMEIKVLIIFTQRFELIFSWKGFQCCYWPSKEIALKFVSELKVYLSKLKPSIIKLCKDHEPQGYYKNFKFYFANFLYVRLKL